MFIYTVEEIYLFTQEAYSKLVTLHLIANFKNTFFLNTMYFHGIFETSNLKIYYKI